MEATAKTGAEPVKKEEPTVIPGAEPGKDAKVSEPSTEKVPWHEDKRWKEWKSTEKKVESLLKKNELEDLDDLIELVESGKKVKGKLQDVDNIEQLIADSLELAKYKRYWAQQEEMKRRDTESSEDTIKRLEHELRKRDSIKQSEAEQKEQAKIAERSVRHYEASVNELLDEDESIPKERKAVMAEFLGVGNAANDIDITDRKAIRKVFKDVAKKFEAYEQAVIKAYIDGKGKVPPITPTEPAAKEEKKIATLKDARSIFKERMTSLFKE